jgi:hypothetical protein
VGSEFVHGSDILKNEGRIGKRWIGDFGEVGDFVMPTGENSRRLRPEKLDPEPQLGAEVIQMLPRGITMEWKHDKKIGPKDWGGRGEDVAGDLADYRTADPGGACIQDGGTDGVGQDMGGTGAVGFRLR